MKIRIAVVSTISALIILMLIGCDDNKGKVHMNEKLNELLDTAVESRDDKYLILRDEIIALDEKEAAALDSKTSDQDWHISLQAEIFLAWRNKKDQVEYIRRLAEGRDSSLEPQKYMTGRPPAENVVEKIREVGPSATPVLLEMIYKEPTATTDYAFTAASLILTEWQDSRAIPVYREILMDTEMKDVFRLMSLTPLVELKAENLYDDLLTVFENAENSLDLRASALTVIGTTGDDRSMPLLKQCLLDTELKSEIRQAAASGLGKTRNEAVLSTLRNQYYETTDLDLRESIVFAFADIETIDALGSLRQIRKIEKDDGMQELIDNTIHSLEYLEE